MVVATVVWPFCDRENMGVPEVNGKQYILDFTRRWKTLRWLELLCYALASSLLAAALCWLITSDPLITALLSGLCGLGTAVFLFMRFRLAALNPGSAAQYLNRKLDRLEYSAELMLAERDSLSLPARLQQGRIEQELLHTGTLKPPVNLLNAGLFLLTSALLVATALYFADHLPTPEKEEVAEERAAMPHPADTTGTHVLREQLPGMTTGVLQVSPPAYTGQKPYTTGLANLRAPENTRLTWQLQFDGTIQALWLSRPGKDSILFQRTKNDYYTAQLDLEQKTLYQLVWRGSDHQTGATDYLKLEVIYDEGPQLQVYQPEQYVRSKHGNAFRIKANARDEWGLTDAYLNMTISRGSGEGVKFREKKLWFEQDFSAQPKEIGLSMELDPAALDMEPGDELYFHLVAFDNRQPRVQQSRTETYIYQWQDTAAESSLELSGLAMEVMPEYFRSQRQIIIDTEKLIEERQDISEAEFEKRAGNLGVDQKLLRLRYGKFLGEEFESGYGAGEQYEGEHGEHRHEPAHHDHENQGHDEQDHEEHGGNEGAEHGHSGHDHAQEDQESATSGSGGSSANMLRDYMHAHDTEEGATFYEEAVKVKLKAALAEMWEAELRLRTLRPKEALPYEYKALEIIKDVQQATRIYVERVGFEPPPLRPAEKRLTGELEAAHSSSRMSSRSPEDTLVAIRELIPKLQPNTRTDAWNLSQADVQLLKRAGDELAAIVQQEPRAEYLQALSRLKEAMNRKEISLREKSFVLKTFLNLLPPQLPEIKRTSYRTDMEKRFIQKIGGSSD
jgi:hypothetical protein